MDDIVMTRRATKLSRCSTHGSQISHGTWSDFYDLIEGDGPSGCMSAAIEPSAEEQVFRPFAVTLFLIPLRLRLQSEDAK
jgi:hypothetical protein